MIGRVFAHRDAARDPPGGQATGPTSARSCKCSSGRSLTLLETPEPDLAYLFKHVITQETAYEPVAVRHSGGCCIGVVAGWIERREASDLAPYYPLLAYHWGRAEEASEDDRVPGAGGEQALGQSAYREAVEFSH